MAGHRVADRYRWLEHGDDPTVVAWDHAQSARTAAILSGLPERDGLHDRLVRLMDVPVVLGADVAGTLLFTVVRGQGRDQAVLTVVDLAEETGDLAEETGDPHGEVPQLPRVLIDPPALLDDPTAALDWWQPSPDGALVAVGLSTGGDELSTLRVVRSADGRLLEDRIERSRAASVAWWPDGLGFACTRYPAPTAVPEGEAGYHRHVVDHRLGTDPADDPVLWSDPSEPTAWPDVRASDDGRWLLVHVSIGWDRTDVHLLDRQAGTWRTVVAGIEARTDLHVRGDHLVGTTTLDAPRGRVVRAPLRDPLPERWTELVPEGLGEDATVIDSVTLTADALLVASTRRATSRLHRQPLDPDGRTLGTLAEIDLPECSSLISLSGSRQRDEAWVGITGFARPPMLLRLDGERLTPRGGSGDAVSPDAFVVESHRYPSTDGTEITLFTLRARSTVPGPGVPTVLSGYGGFGVTMSPAFSAEAVTLAERGGVWAVACIRGGGEEGETWHQAGQGPGKVQVYADFEAAADWLVAEGRTSREVLVIRGGSNGGLLVTAVLTRRPDLCAAALAAVPLCDMVRFARFGIARLWIPEYGDPDQPADLAWLLAASPYHHVRPGVDYPAVLLTTGAQDSRVDPLHARKMAAALQDATTGARGPVLLRVEQSAGHGQGKPTSRRAEEAADVLAFLTHRWATRQA